MFSIPFLFYRATDAVSDLCRAVGVPMPAQLSAGDRLRVPEPCGTYHAALPIPGQAASCMRETKRTLDRFYVCSTLNIILLSNSFK